MSAKMEYKGSDVSAAISQACRALKVNQEQLDIEVLHAGSTGIFGLCRQKAVIKVSLKVEEGKPPAQPSEQPLAEIDQESPRAREPEPKKKPAPKPKPARQEQQKPKDTAPSPEPVVEVSQEVLDSVRQDVLQIIALMGFTATVTVEQSEGKVTVDIDSENAEELIGPEGQTLDGLQYVLRKILSRKFSRTIMLSIDAGGYRDARAEELRELARRLLAEVRETGKTRTIPPINPAERRIVHMVLQKESDIRSRSVGAGIYKKILIYVPGKGRKKQVKKDKK